MMESDVAGNPVGELQEFTQKKLIKPPIYEFGNEDGPPHNREFICTVKLGKFTEKGRFFVRVEWKVNLLSFPSDYHGIVKNFLLWQRYCDKIKDTYKYFVKYAAPGREL